MKIKFNHKPVFGRGGQSSHKTDTTHREREPKAESLQRIYESPKTMLKKTLDVIELSVNEQLQTLFDDYIKWRKGQAKRPEYIFNMLQDISFVSVLPKIVDMNYDFFMMYGEEFSEIISSAVGELTKRNPPLSRSREMIAIYSNIYEDINEERVKRVFRLEIPGVEWEDALKLCIVSHGTPGHTMHITLRTIYSIVKTYEYDKVRKLFVKLYGKEDMGRVGVHILLEHAPGGHSRNWSNVTRELYSRITNIALDEIESRKKKEIKSLMKLYCEERRKSEFDKFVARRITMSSINKDDYAKIHKVVRKLSKENKMYRGFLGYDRVKP